MRFLLLPMMILVCTSASMAIEPSDYRVPIKPGASIGDGGVLLQPRDTVESPIGIVIPSLPFTATGNTCESINSLDVVCPYIGSTAPEVIYSFTPESDIHIGIDLCDSSYDTKVYVLDTFMNVIGCNDDAYFDPPCYPFSSFLDVILSGGVEYLIVVDGYGDDCGDYALFVDTYLSCVSPEPHAMTEGEPPFFMGYQDLHNGGCYEGDPPPVQAFFASSLGGGGCGFINGSSGWYEDLSGSTVYDSDWYEIVAAGSTLELGLHAVEPSFLVVIEDDCETGALVHVGLTDGSCAKLYDYIQVVPGRTYWIFVEPYFEFGDHETYDYVLEVCGHAWDVLPNAAATWGGIKSIYR